MLLSCILPNYNHGHFLEERLTSILSQMPSDGELIVIDDASTDNSRLILNKIASTHPRCRVIYHHTNQGVECTVNRGIQEAQGTYLLPMSADDVLLPGGLQSYVAVIQSYPDAYLFFSDDGQDIRGVRSHCQAVRGATHDLLLTPQLVIHLLRQRSLYIPGHTVVVKKEVVLQCGGYNRQLGSFSDAFLNLCVAFMGPSVYVHREIAVWRALETSYSSSYKRSKKLQNQAEIALLNVVMHHPLQRQFRISGCLNRFVRKHPLFVCRHPKFIRMLCSSYLHKIFNIGF